MMEDQSNAQGSVPAAALPEYGTKTMLLGATGSGKTHCIRTLIDAGIKPFVIFTEPGMRTLANVPKEKLHWHYIQPAAVSWDEMRDSATKINTLSLKLISGMEGINKQKYTQFIELLTFLKNFKCDRTGEEFGDVATWGSDKALVIDSLSGINVMAMDLVTGSKPVKSMADWGMAMDNEIRLIDMLCTGTKCHFVLTAHQEREQDEISGSIKVMASILGKKLAPRLPRNFDDVVQCVQGSKPGEFWWQTISSQSDLKYRNLPPGEKLPPSFVPLIESWKKAYA